MNLGKAVGLIIGFSGLAYAFKSSAEQPQKRNLVARSDADSHFINDLQEDFLTLVDNEYSDSMVDIPPDDLERFGQSITPVSKPKLDNKYIDASKVKTIAKSLINRYNFAYIGSLDEYARFILSMAITESSLNKYATRKESGGRVSYGLMQALNTTVAWLYDDMGYRGYSVQSFANFDVEASIYFGLAFNDWVIKRHKRENNGLEPSHQFLAESYNGGYGKSNSMTQNHWRKIQINWER